MTAFEFNAFVSASGFISACRFEERFNIKSECTCADVRHDASRGSLNHRTVLVTNVVEVTRAE